MQSAGKRRTATTKKEQVNEQQSIGSQSSRKTKRKRTQPINSPEPSSPELTYIVKQLPTKRKPFHVPFVEIAQKCKKKFSQLSKKRIQVSEDLETTLSIGDTVLLSSDREDSPFIARVEDIVVKPRISANYKKQHNWQHGKNCSIWLSLRWFYQPFEIVVPSNIKLSKNEVFLSDHVDTNSIECYLDKCTIGFSTENAVEAGSSTFTCKYFYDCLNAKIRPLKKEDTLILSYLHNTSGNARNKEAKLLLRPSENDLTDSKITKNILVGREQEIERIQEFLVQSILDVSQGRSKGGRSLYINGVPGTGKTASVRHVLELLKENNEYNGKFVKVEINGMLLADPQEAYSLLYSTIFKTTVGYMKAAQQLDRYFGEGMRTTQLPKRNKGYRYSSCIIAVLDELDVMLTKKQKVVYDFLEWCARENSPLVVVAIANTMDLPERVLQPRIGSRFGVNRLSFAPYTSSQLRNILEMEIPRLLQCSLDCFEPLSVELCCKKVASVTGDVRRAFHVCQRATEIAQKEGSERIGMTHIQEAFVEMYNKGPTISVGQLSLVEKAVYCAALLCERHYGADSIFLAKLAKHTQELCQRLSLPFDLDIGKLLGICYNLSFSRHVTLQCNAAESFCKIFCNVQFDDFCYAVQGTPFYDFLNSLSK